MSKLRIVIAINYVNYSDPRKRQLQDRAISILDRVAPPNVTLISFNLPEDVVNLPAHWRNFTNLTQNSQKIIGNSRPLPYIYELFDICSKLQRYDIFGYINSDILINKDFFKIFSNDIDAYVFYKRDIEEVTYEKLMSGNFRVIWADPPGQDGFFFKRAWWAKNKKLFPKELILGETEWDTCYNSILQYTTKKLVIKRALHHIHHDRKWNLTSNGAKNNIGIWDTIREKCGLPANTPETFND